MIQMMTTTLQAAGLPGGDVLRRAVGFAITAGGFAVIAAHGLHHVVAG